MNNIGSVLATLKQRGFEQYDRVFPERQRRDAGKCAPTTSAANITAAQMEFTARQRESVRGRPLEFQRLCDGRARYLLVKCRTRCVSAWISCRRYSATPEPRPSMRTMDRFDRASDLNKPLAGPSRFLAIHGADLRAAGRVEAADRSERRPWKETIQGDNALRYHRRSLGEEQCCGGAARDRSEADRTSRGVEGARLQIAAVNRTSQSGNKFQLRA